MQFQPSRSQRQNRLNLGRRRTSTYSCKTQGEYGTINTSTLDIKTIDCETFNPVEDNYVTEEMRFEGYTWLVIMQEEVYNVKEKCNVPTGRYIFAFEDQAGEGPTWGPFNSGIKAEIFGQGVAITAHHLHPDHIDECMRRKELSEADFLDKTSYLHDLFHEKINTDYKPI